MSRLPVHDISACSIQCICHVTFDQTHIRLPENWELQCVVHIYTAQPVWCDRVGIFLLYSLELLGSQKSPFIFKYPASRAPTGRSFIHVSGFHLHRKKASPCGKKIRASCLFTSSFKSSSAIRCEGNDLWIQVLPCRWSPEFKACSDSRVAKTTSISLKCYIFQVWSQLL